MSKTTSFFDFAKIENENEFKLNANSGAVSVPGVVSGAVTAGSLLGYPTAGFSNISNAYKTSLVPASVPGSVGGTFSAGALLNTSPGGSLVQKGDLSAGKLVDASAAQSGAVGETVGETAGAGIVPNQALVDSLKRQLFGKSDSSEAAKLEFDAWKAQYGVDTDKNFQDSVSRLDYEMKTWAANYGANAERLARMGLSNSGMVDIYGTGVVQAYLQSMNDLYLAKAEGDRQNAEAYKKYSDEYEADLAARTATKNNNILAAYNYGLGLYNGSNLNEVTTMIRNAGYDEDVITEAVTRLGAVDASMLPALQTQLAQEQTDVNAMIEQLLSNGYTADMEQSATDFLKATYGWSDEKIAKVIQGANGLLGMTPKADNLTAGIQAVNEMLAKNNAAYDGSEAQKTSIRQALRGTEYEAMTEQIIAQLDADLGEVKGAAALDEIAEIEAVDVDTLTMGDIEAELTDAATKYGVDSEEYKNILKSWGGKTGQMFERAFDDLAEAQSIFGIADDTVINDNGVTWAEADEAARGFYVEQRLNDAHESGLIGDDAYMKIMTGLYKDDATRMKGAEDIASVLRYFNDLMVNKVITDAQRKTLIETVAQNAKVSATLLRDDSFRVVSAKVKIGGGVDAIEYFVTEADDVVAEKVAGMLQNGKDIYELGGNLYIYDEPNKKAYKLRINTKSKEKGGEHFNEFLTIYAAGKTAGKKVTDTTGNRYIK